MTGHVPLTLTVEEVAQAGQNIEHYNEYLPGCVRNEKALKAELERARIGGSAYDFAIIHGYNRRTAEALFRQFAAQGTWVTPTLGIAHIDAFPPANDPATEARRRYLPAAWLASWSDRSEQIDPSWDIRDSRQQYRHALETVRLMHHAGVPILAGSDTGIANAGTIPGFSLQDELGYLVDAGLKPVEALQCATINAAKWLGKLDSLGAVERGKLADLVLLDASPLANIRNVRKIRAVVTNGRLLDRERLDRMLLELGRQPDPQPRALAGFGVQRHLAAQRPHAPLDAHWSQPQQL